MSAPTEHKADSMKMALPSKKEQVKIAGVLRSAEVKTNFSERKKDEISRPSPRLATRTDDRENR